MASPGVGGSLSAASDVALNNPADGQVLKRDNGYWKNLADVSGGSGSIYVTTTNATLPPGLAEGTVIARYDASGPATPVVTMAGGNTSITSGPLTFTTTANIDVGDALLVAVTKAVQSTDTVGTAAVSLSTGAAGTWSRASACRSSTYDHTMLAALVTTAIPSGTTVTITSTGNSQYRTAAVLAKVTNIESVTPDATTGNAAAGQSGDVTVGPTASSAASITITSPTATTVATIAFAAAAGNSASTYAFGTGWTEVGQRFTAAGSSDRGVVLGYRVYNNTATPSATINSSPTSSMSGTMMSLPLKDS